MDGLAVPGKLKLKKGSGVSKKKKKSSSEKKETSKEPMVSAAVEGIAGQIVEQASKSVAPKKTKAELAFEKRKAEQMNERILKKAQSSHREKVEKFNEKMDSLTEFNDIPKVSWTK